MAPPGFAVGHDIGVVLADDQCPVADVVVLVGEDLDDTRVNFPAALAALVAEVVSPATRATDRFRKPGQFAEAGIPVAYELGDDGHYVEVARAEPGRELRRARLFPVVFDPAVLLR